MSETKIEEWQRKIRNGRRKEAIRKQAEYEAAKAETWDRLSKPYKRKLKAIWSIDIQQDLGVLHGTELEDELAKELAKNIAKDLDDEIFNKLSKMTKK